ncbi:MAG: hypothetical protein OXH77_06655 [Anaerolineaceae bacterium]|nr:hypothetical protein [Anaerolineaceae bacterium]
MSDERILTLHPEGKKGVNILRSKYDPVRAALLDSLRAGGGELTHKELMGAVAERLVDFSGSVTWYAETVKLDLVARGTITRSSGSPQVLTLVED